MKTKFYTLVLCTLSLATFFGCKNGHEPESLFGNTEKPSWSAPANYDMTSSMTAVVKVDLSANYPSATTQYQLSTEDILAAFSGDDCLSIAHPISMGEGQGEGFFLYICAPTQGKNVTLRYYSSVLKNIFVAEPFAFVNDTQLGSVAKPYMPLFAIEK